MCYLQLDTCSTYALAPYNYHSAVQASQLLFHL